MYIPEFVCGIFATLTVELVIVLALAVRAANRYEEIDLEDEDFDE